MTQLEITLLILCIYLFSIIMILCYKPFRKTAKIDNNDLLLWLITLLVAPLFAFFIIVTSPFLIE